MVLANGPALPDADGAGRTSCGPGSRLSRPAGPGHSRAPRQRTPPVAYARGSLNVACRAKGVPRGIVPSPQESRIPDQRERAPAVDVKTVPHGADRVKRGAPPRGKPASSPRVLP